MSQFAGLACSIVFILAQLAPAAPETGAPIECELRLRNGSVIRGTWPKLEQITIKLKYGELQVPLRDLRSLSWGDGKKKELDTVVAAAGTYRGWIGDLPPIELDTGYGVLKVPTNAVKMIRITRRGEVPSDDFSGGELGERWTTYGAARWSVQDERLTCTPSGNYDGILFADELEESWTLETEVSNANGAGILFCAEDNQNAAALWLNPGQVMVFCGSPWYGQQIATWHVHGHNQGTLRIKIEFDDGKLTVSVNDNKVGETTVPKKRGRVGFFAIHQPAWFDNFKIEK